MRLHLLPVYCTFLLYLLQRCMRKVIKILTLMGQIAVRIKVPVQIIDVHFPTKWPNKGLVNEVIRELYKKCIVSLILHVRASNNTR